MRLNILQINALNYTIIGREKTNVLLDAILLHKIKSKNLQAPGKNK